MTTVTSLTADRMLAIEAASVVDGDVVGGNLILTKHDGSQINAGPVTGPTGPQGPQGALLPVISGVPVLDVGLANQIRAGRQLTAADFTNMGLSAPIALWNLSDLTDVSGNGRNLNNKGALPFGVGINGVAGTAAQFSGSPAQGLYISDTGANDPFRIKTGSWGCWFRTAKRNLTQVLFNKTGTANGTYSWNTTVDASNAMRQLICIDGATVYLFYTISDVADGRWHFAVTTWDGSTLRVYVDCNIEINTPSASGPLFGSPTPLGIGGSGQDANNPSGNPMFGPMDEAFFTADVLSEDQIRNLYCVKIPHTLAVTPSRISLNVHRRCKGATLAVSDFPTQPLRLYNFSGGSAGDEGSNGVVLTNNGASPSVSGVDGSGGNAFSFNGTNQSLSSTDAGLPAGLTARSFGAWFKTTNPGGEYIICWGILGSNDARITIGQSVSGYIGTYSGSDVLTGPFVADGQWHHVVVTEYNAVGSPTDDGIKRKLYIDGRLVGSSTTLASITLAGAGAFRIAQQTGSGAWFNGQIDGVFVCDYALTPEQVAKLYAKGSQTLASSPKNPGDHIEAMSTSSLLATFDTLESQHTIDLGVEP